MLSSSSFGWRSLVFGLRRVGQAQQTARLVSNSSGPASSSSSSSALDNLKPKLEVEEEDEDAFRIAAQNRSRELERLASAPTVNKPRPEVLADMKRSLSNVDDSREPLPPVAKDLFLAKVHHNILSYPDVLENDRYHAMEDRLERLKVDLEMMAKRQPEGKELLKGARQAGLLGLRGHVDSGGQGLCMTESMRVLEEVTTLTSSFSLSELLAVVNTNAVSAIETFGSESQRKRYLPKLYSGEWTGALCVADKECGTDVTATTVKADYDSELGAFCLNGTKRFVTNAANADVFTVYANVVQTGLDGRLAPASTALLVEKDETVEIGQQEQLAGPTGLDVRSVTFRNTQVNASSDTGGLLGEIGRGAEIHADSTKRDRCITGARVASVLRGLVDATVSYANRRKTFGRFLNEFDQVKLRLCRASARVYALESMSYMTAGIADVQTDEDLAVEAAMTKVFAAQAAREVIEHCSAILGIRSYSSHEQFQHIFRDLSSIDLWEGSTDILRIGLAIEAIAHVGKQRVEEVRKWRNPMTFPVKWLLKEREVRRTKKGYPSKKLYLDEHVHGSLHQAADYLELTVLRLSVAADMALVLTGSDIGGMEMPLVKLADAGTEAYAILSSLARANRSYCHGQRHGEHEVHLARSVGCYGHERADTAVQSVIDGQQGINNDGFAVKVSDYMCEQGRYAPVHPFSRNVF